MERSVLIRRGCVCEVTKWLKFVMLNGSWSTGREMFIVKQEY